MGIGIWQEKCMVEKRDGCRFNPLEIIPRFKNCVVDTSMDSKRGSKRKSGGCEGSFFIDTEI